MTGFLLVMSGPSGVGKGTLVNEIAMIRDDIVVSRSVTTRYKRSNETDGKEYYFIDKKKYDEMVENDELLEHAEVHGNFYGTPRKFVEDNIADGKIVILEIDVQGAEQVRNNFKNTVNVFVIPPRKSDIEERLRKRGTETEEKIKTRLENANHELEQIKYYDYFLVNDYVAVATKRLEDIIEEERERRR